MVSSRRELDELSGKNQILISARAAEYTISAGSKNIKKEDRDEFARIEKKI